MYLGKGKNKRKVFDDKINNPVSIRIIGKWKEEEEEDDGGGGKGRGWKMRMGEAEGGGTHSTTRAALKGQRSC